MLSAAKINKELKHSTPVGDLADFEVRYEDALTHSVVRTAHGWSAEVRVQTAVVIDGVVHGGERVIRIPLEA